MLIKKLKPKAHFLHIGKTGGTAIKEAIGNDLCSGKYYLSLHSHKVTIIDIPRGEKIFFFLRNPINRYISGFYSRFRKGAPRYNCPWSEGEKTYFEAFRTPNELALSLSADDVELKKKAEFAMRSIGHVKTNYSYWFNGINSLFDRIEDIIFIGFQEELSHDFEKLKIKLCLPERIALPTSEVKAHKTPAFFDKKLDKEAITNLNFWYKEDLIFIEICKQLQLNQLGLIDRISCLTYKMLNRGCI